MDLSVVQEAACHFLDQDNADPCLDMTCVFRHRIEPFFSVSNFYSRQCCENESPAGHSIWNLYPTGLTTLVEYTRHSSSAEQSPV